MGEGLAMHLLHVYGIYGGGLPTSSCRRLFVDVVNFPRPKVWLLYNDDVSTTCYRKTSTS